MTIFGKRRRRKEARLRLLAVAERIDARDGTVLKEKFSGGAGLNGPLVLGIITLRPGQADDVAQRQIDAAQAAGYTLPPTPPCGGGGCGFLDSPHMPFLTIETFFPGEIIPLQGIVPNGHTGVIISLS